MAGGGFSGLTSQTLYPLSCGSDTISSRNPARPHTSDRYAFYMWGSDRVAKNDQLLISMKLNDNKINIKTN